MWEGFSRRADLAFWSYLGSECSLLGWPRGGTQQLRTPQVRHLPIQLNGTITPDLSGVAVLCPVPQHQASPSPSSSSPKSPWSIAVCGQPVSHPRLTPPRTLEMSPQAQICLVFGYPTSSGNQAPKYLVGVGPSLFNVWDQWLFSGEERSEGLGLPILLNMVQFIFILPWFFSLSFPAFAWHPRRAKLQALCIAPSEALFGAVLVRELPCSFNPYAFSSHDLGLLKTDHFGVNAFSCKKYKALGLFLVQLALLRHDVI